MLYNIDPILSPELLYTLRAMGHGDEIVLGDANFPAESIGPTCIRADGSDCSDVLRAVLSLMPLDTFVPHPAHSMAVVDDPDTTPEAVAEFQTIIGEVAGDSRTIKPIERFAFYERAAKAFAIVQTGERRLYGNVILTKGVVA